MQFVTNKANICLFTGCLSNNSYIFIHIQSVLVSLPWMYLLKNKVDIRHPHVLFSRNTFKNYLIIHIYSFSNILFSFYFYQCIWSKMNMIFVILVLILIGIDTSMLKIVRYTFHTSAAFRLFPAHMEGFGPKKKLIFVISMGCLGGIPTKI
jgi:hypothetical protein